MVATSAANDALVNPAELHLSLVQLHISAPSGCPLQPGSPTADPHALITVKKKCHQVSISLILVC